jgi:hypothetical protein
MRKLRFMARIGLPLLLAAPFPLIGWLTSPAAAAGGNHGGIVTNFGFGIDGPEGIITGPDGALWFTNSADNSIGRITTEGVVSNYRGLESTNLGGSRSAQTGRCGSPTPATTRLAGSPPQGLSQTLRPAAL